MVSVDFSPILRALKEVYSEKFFPFLFLFGAMLVTAMTNDFLWLVIGIVGMFYFEFRRPGV